MKANYSADRLAHILGLACALTALTTVAKEPIKLDLAQIKPGQLMSVNAGGTTVWVVSRTEADRSSLASGPVVSSDPPSARNSYRSVKPELLVVRPACPGVTDLPTYHPSEGFRCTNGVRFDLAGRSLDAAPMPIPDHFYEGATTLVLTPVSAGTASK